MDLVKQKFNRLEVIKFSHNDKYSSRIWKCKCECGNIVLASTNSLRRNNTKSCGCLQKEKAAISGRNSATTHGLSKDSNGKKTRLFRIWMGMKTRCYNPNVVEYPRYGGKGVVICEEWKNFEAFHNWALTNGYQENLSIDRKELSGNYEPSNCRWVTDKVQCRNRTSSRIIDFNGQQKTLVEWAEINSMSINCLFERLKRGWSIEKALTTKIQIKIKNQ